MTSLNMPGVSLTILKLPQDEDLIQYIDKPVDAPGWMNYVTADTSQLDVELDEKVSDSTHVPISQNKVIGNYVFILNKFEFLSVPIV